MRRLYLRIAVPVLILFSLQPEPAQEPLAGAIKGIVRDNRGAPIPRVALTATNLDSGSRHYSASDENGFFDFVDLSPGRYSLRAHMAGYQDFAMPLIKVRDGEHADLGTIKMVQSTGGDPRPPAITK